MKRVIRDVFCVLLLFTAVLAAPVIMENFSAKAGPQEKQAPILDGLQDGDRLVMPEEMPMSVPASDCPTLEKQANDAPSADGVRYDGGKGFDTLITDEAGEIKLDGSRFVGMERAVLRHGTANTIRIKISGLVELKNNTQVIEADPGLDTVFLDACLSWKPSRSDGQGNMIYEGEDVAGNRAYVFVNEGVNVAGGN